MEYIEIKDFVLLPIYLFIIYIIAYHKRNRRYSVKNPLYKYYIPALTVKLLGALSVGLIYQYYYDGAGDTFQYFYNAKLVADYFSTDLQSFIALVFKPIIFTLQLRSQVNWGNAVFGYSESNYFIIRVLAILQLIGFYSYIPCALMLSAISFTGVWKAYTAFVNMFPALHKQFAIAFLFMPSVFFWGSGILKDTITLTALCWLFYASYLLFILRRKMISSAIKIGISVFVIIVVKPYIALAFLPSLIFWIFFQYRSNIRSSFLRVMALPFILLIIAFIGYKIINTIGASTENFGVKNIVNNATSFNANNQIGSGSSLNIGVTDKMSATQIVTIAPLAIITAIFRPFLWEIRSLFMLFSSLEGVYVLYISIIIILRNGITNMFNVISRIPLATFCFVFGLIFSFAIGFSTSNFGTLVRYKIPATPFLMAGLFIVLEKGGKKKENLFIKNKWRLSTTKSHVENAI